MAPQIIYSKALTASPTSYPQLQGGGPCRKGQTAKQTGCTPATGRRAGGPRGRPRKGSGARRPPIMTPKEEAELEKKTIGEVRPSGDPKTDKHRMDPSRSIAPHEEPEEDGGGKSDRAADIRAQAGAVWGGQDPRHIEDSIEDLTNDLRQAKKDKDSAGGPLRQGVIKKMERDLRVAKSALKDERRREARSARGWKGQKVGDINADAKSYKDQLERQNQQGGSPEVKERLKEKIALAEGAAAATHGAWEEKEAKAKEKAAQKEERAKQKEERAKQKEERAADRAHEKERKMDEAYDKKKVAARERAQREQARERARESKEEARAEKAYEKEEARRSRERERQQAADQKAKERQEAADEKAKERAASPQGAIDRALGEHTEKHRTLVGKTREALDRASDAIKSRGESGAAREIEIAVSAQKELNQHRRDMARDIKTNDVGKRVQGHVSGLEREAKGLDRMWDRLGTRGRVTPHGVVPRGKKPRGVKAAPRDTGGQQGPSLPADMLKKAANWAKKTWAERQAAKAQRTQQQPPTPAGFPLPKARPATSRPASPAPPAAKPTPRPSRPAGGPTPPRSWRPKPGSRGATIQPPSSRRS